MKKHSPCPEWTTKLALRWNDFSPSEWRTFEAHMKECTGCSARRAEYGVLIAELQMLPSPTQQATPGPLTYMPHESGEEPLEVYDCFTHPGILDAEIYFKQASALFSSAQYYEALPLCNYALKLDPENEEIWALKGKILAAQWSYKEALAACDQALKLKSDEVAFLSMQASLLYTLKRYEEALRATKKLLKRDPHNLEGWHIKAWALQKLKRYPEAIKACDSALTLNSDIGAIWKVKCRSLLALRKYKEALEACNRALEKRVGD